MKNTHNVVSLNRKITFTTLIFILVNVFLLAGCSNGQKESEKGFAYISSQKGNVLVIDGNEETNTNIFIKNKYYDNLMEKVYNFMLN